MNCRNSITLKTDATRKSSYGALYPFLHTLDAIQTEANRSKALLLRSESVCPYIGCTYMRQGCQLSRIGRETHVFQPVYALCGDLCGTGYVMAQIRKRVQISVKG